MIIDSGELAMMRAGTVRIVPIMLIKTPTPVRIAASFGDFDVSSDAVDATGGTYTGIGTLQNMPGLELLFNGQASRADFTLSAFGSQGDALASALEADTSDLSGAPVHVGFLLLDSALQAVGNAYWLWPGKCDKSTITKQPGDKERGPVKTTGISVGTRFVRRKHGNPAYYTDSEQKQRSSDDDFCINVRGYQRDTTKPWPTS